MNKSGSIQNQAVEDMHRIVVQVSDNEQSSASDLIARKVEVISSMSEENTTAMGEAKKSMDEMRRLTTEMHEMVDRFQV